MIGAMPLDIHPHELEPDGAVSTRVQKAAIPLYASRIKVYPKAVAGTYRRIKWVVLAACLAIYYVGTVASEHPTRLS
jgi:hypothetical protein